MDVSVNKRSIKALLENDRRDIKDLWNNALEACRYILPGEFQATFAVGTYGNVETIVNRANEQMEAWHHFRHNKSKVDKLRSLFSENIRLVELTGQKIIAAAAPAFPPAAAIGTAFTFMIAACRSVSADYDIVTAFFDDMNSFLQRLSILEKRLPAYKAYDACLTDVFISLLKMSAFATKFMKLQRFQKWVINAFKGEDGELAGARKDMDGAIDKLQAATEYAILANTLDLQEMQKELQQNTVIQLELATRQQEMLETIVDEQTNIRHDIANLRQLILMKQELVQEKSSSGDKTDQTVSATNRVRSIIPGNPENDVQLRSVLDSQIPGTCQWVFETSEWQKWFKPNHPGSAGTETGLVLSGPSGIGKTYLAASIYSHILEMAKADPGSFSCATYFFCRDNFSSLRTYQSVINAMVLQVSEQNLVLREQFNDELSKDIDNQVTEAEYFEKLLVPHFRSHSSYTLYLVLDGLNAFQTEHDQQLLLDMVSRIAKEDLCIKVVITTRPEVKIQFSVPGERPISISSEIAVSKDKILPDLKTIVEDRLHSKDSAFQGVQALSPSGKAKVSQTLQQVATGLLYAEQAVRYMSSIGREGTILRELQNMPRDINGLFEKTASLCERRTPPDLVEPVRTLFIWLTFCFDPLTLSGANNLIQLISNNLDLRLEDDIEDIWARCLRIQSIAIESDDLIATSDSVYDAGTPETVVDDGDVEVAYREPSMREFFRSQKALGAAELLNTESKAHRQMFLICHQLIARNRNQKPASMLKGSRKLGEYALRYCLLHWKRIDRGQHTTKQLIEVYEAFTDLMYDPSGFAAQIELLGTSIDELLIFHKSRRPEYWHKDFLNIWSIWSAEIEKDALLRDQLTSASLTYWTGTPDDAFLPLAKGHIQNWLNASSADNARNSYYFARCALKVTSLRTVLCQEFLEHYLRNAERWQDSYWPQAYDSGMILEVYAIRNLLTDVTHANAHYATAVILRYIFKYDEAATEIQEAVEMAENHVELFRYRVYLANVLGTDYALDDEFLADRSLQIALSDRRNVPTPDIIFALRTQAAYKFNRQGYTDPEDLTAGLDAYKELRHVDPSYLIPGSILAEEYLNRWMASEYQIAGAGQFGGVVEMLLDLTPVQRVTLLTHSGFWENGAEPKIHRQVFKAALALDRIDDLLRVYKQVVRSLESEKVAAIWSKYLAHVHWRGAGDTGTAKEVIVKALGNSYSRSGFALVNTDAGLVTVRNINIASDIVYAQFQQSNNLSTKQKLLKEMGDISQLRLPQSVQINLASTIPYLLVQARMLQKVGSAQEHRNVLQQAFDICWQNLHDSLTSNDSINIALLSRVVGQLPAMQREAEVLSSSQLYHVGGYPFFRAYLRHRKKEHLLTLEIETRVKEVAETRLTIDEQGRFPGVFQDLILLDDEWSFGTKVEPDIGPDVQMNEETGDYRQELVGQFMYSVSNWCETWYYLQSFCNDPEARTWKAPRCTNCTWAEDSGFKDFEPVLLNPQTPPFIIKMYTCLVCTESILCETCYDLRIKLNNIEGHQPSQNDEKVMPFCCANGRYLRAPAERWEGVTSAKIYLRGEQPVHFNVFLDRVKLRWEDAWQQYFQG